MERKTEIGPVQLAVMVNEVVSSAGFTSVGLAIKSECNVYEPDLGQLYSQEAAQPKQSASSTTEVSSSTSSVDSSVRAAGGGGSSGRTALGGSESGTA
ncbi:hypothetical protein DER29_2294 [Micromonospora sp. M71_S20]|uniref:hypothetical protein n=1 Tax=Micromonospora sp. M71_S20 TaxID=592872 RepID=UPI000F0F8E55|nr:hypothetical protein [Micromonospora sp. M71_S20]RLK24390.1 hypothetical protein DER29_2294 [Micromonospora sp. M71_S20]